MLLVREAADVVRRAACRHGGSVGQRPELPAPVREVLALDAVHHLRVLAPAPLQPKRLAELEAEGHTRLHVRLGRAVEVRDAQAGSHRQAAEARLVLHVAAQEGTRVRAVQELAEVPRVQAPVRPVRAGAGQLGVELVRDVVPSCPQIAGCYSPDCWQIPSS